MNPVKLHDVKRKNKVKDRTCNKVPCPLMLFDDRGVFFEYIPRTNFCESHQNRIDIQSNIYIPKIKRSCFNK